MAAIIVGTTGATWGLSAEVGIIVQSAGAKDSREKNEVRNEIGEFALVSYYNPLKKHTIAGVFKGTTGIAGAQPGLALTVANAYNTYGGATAGLIYTDDLDIAGVNNEFLKLTVNATQYPLITS